MKASASTLAAMKKNGLVPISVDDGFKALTACLATNSSNIMVIHGDPERIAKWVQELDTAPLPSYSKQADSSREMANTHDDKVPQEVVVNRSRSDERIQEKIFSAIAKTINIDKSEIDPDATFLEYGFDSMTLTELSMTIRKQLDINIAPTVFFELPNIESLIDWVTDAEHSV